MSKIIIADLSSGICTEKDGALYSQDYGRGLGLRLLKEYTVGTHDPEGDDNALVILPGLLTGNLIPCATRAMIMSNGKNGNIKICNFTGDLPQKMASSGICALVVKGRSENGRSCILVQNNKVEIIPDGPLLDVTCDEAVDVIRGKYGEAAAAIGTGPAGDMELSISSLFVTYPEGTPRFYCPRSGYGDILGRLGLKALIIVQDKSFTAGASDSLIIKEKGKALSGIITGNEICGEALPGLGSITLLKLMKEGKKINIGTDFEKKGNALSKHKGKLNFSCAPYCVIGCLNKHSGSDGLILSAPEESEVHAALSEFLPHVSKKTSSALNSRGFQLGINTTEFIRTLALYGQAAGLNLKEEDYFTLLEEVFLGTPLGRILGGGTHMIGEVYKEKDEIRHNITMPSVSLEKDFNSSLKRLYDDDLDLPGPDGLYTRIFVLENLGICLFSSFALLDSRESMDILGELVTATTGVSTTGSDLLSYSWECIKREMEYQRLCCTSKVQKKIPEFVKVLYKYFSKEDESNFR